MFFTGWSLMCKMVDRSIRKEKITAGLRKEVRKNNHSLKIKIKETKMELKNGL